MAGRIKILPENLANRIAAGEVVERPAAVVKELVENSLDAGATDIVVEIEGGGKKLIRVSDDGSGMSREDALLSLERHATSKIATDSDLGSIETLGFRGEALPSIASVSRLNLSSRVREQMEGTEIYAEGGKIVSVKAHGMAVGTTIEIRNLFYNTPARLKFMRNSETEAGHVGELVSRLAISRPDIRFTYISDGKKQFRALPGNLSARAEAFLGTAAVRNLWSLDGADGGFAIRGLISDPELTRSSASGLYTFVNGRFIRDKVVQHAIVQSYRGVIEKGRYPVVVLFIELPLGDLDVNVHPTKHEVRFREQGKVHDAIQAAVEKILRVAPWVTRAPQMLSDERSATTAISSQNRVEGVREALSRYTVGSSTRQPTFSTSCISSSKSFQQLSRQQEQAPGPATSGYYASLTLLGQFNSMYILCQDENNLVIIDQHAAYERIAYQQLRFQHQGAGVESQGLLFPETIDLSFSETATLLENASAISQLGFELDNYGGTTHALRGVPRLLADKDYLRALRDIIVELEQISRSSTAERFSDNLLARMACHSVVRGSRSLSVPEIKNLFAQMDQCDFAATCPHGRPVIARITLGEIEKMFKRSRTDSSI